MGDENDTALRLRYLDPSQGRFGLFVLTEDGYEERVDLSDTGNIDTRVERRAQRAGNQTSTHDALENELRRLPFVEVVEQNDNSFSFRVRGLEFARRNQNEFSFGSKPGAPRQHPT